MRANGASDRRVRFIVPLLLALLLLAGCVSSELQGVHDTYRSEFQAVLTAQNDGSKEGSSLTPTKGRFPVTLSAIASFRVRHPGEADANKHLAVLEAMVYLQSGQFGMARLAAKTAEELPGDLTSADGGAIRDRLFLDALISSPGLIDAFKLLGDELPDGVELEKAARRLAKLAKDAKIPAGDDGAAYVASIASICYLGAMESELQGVTGTPEQRAEKRSAIRKKFGELVVDALAPHLTDGEKALPGDELKNIARWSVRHRYIRLYVIGKGYSEGT